jgi:hypothetical protein
MAHTEECRGKQHTTIHTLYPISFVSRPVFHRITAIISTIPADEKAMPDNGVIPPT